jgi:HK97 family phage portal protein
MRRNTRTNELEYYVQPVVGDQIQLPLNRIMHLRGLSRDGLMGMSPIAVARESIGLGIASEEFAAGFFANGARPPLILKHPGQLSETAHNRLRADFEATHAGLSNAQRVALLEEGMDVASNFVPMDDAQFIENRKFSVEEIARLYRVHPHKIAVMEGTQTFASVEQANIDHVVSTIRPWCVRWEQAIRKDLIPAEERDTYYAEHELTALLRGDNASRADFYTKMFNIGVFSQNMILELENMSPVEGGDEHFIPLNMGPVNVVANPQPPANVRSKQWMTSNAAPLRWNCASRATKTP